MDKFRVFVYMLMRDASLKQRIPCIMRISIFGAFSAGKKCALYVGKYGIQYILFRVLRPKSVIGMYIVTAEATDVACSIVKPCVAQV